MKALKISLVAALAAAVAMPAAARDSGEESVVQQEVAFRVSYADGTSERYVAKYVGFVRRSAHETGGPAVPLRGKFNDDRQCHWSINSRIERTVYLAHRSGRQVPYDPLAVRWEVPFTNKGSDFVLLRLRSENCNEAWSRYQSDLNDARQRVRNDFPGVMQADLDSVKKAMASELQAAAITELPR